MYIVTNCLQQLLSAKNEIVLPSPLVLILNILIGLLSQTMNFKTDFATTNSRLGKKLND